MFSEAYKFSGNLFPLLFLLSIGTGGYPMGGDYGRKDLEDTNMKAPRVFKNLWGLLFLAFSISLF